MNAVAAHWLRLRHGWPVRWAHHPLCARHAHETWRIGRLRLCRGCVALATGVIGGTAAVLAAGGLWCAWTLAAIGPVAFAASWPPLYHRLPRWLRDLLRVATGVSITLIAWVAGSWPTIAWPLLPALGLLWWRFRRARERVLARRCLRCPELGAGEVCSGYRLAADCARALEADVEARIMAKLTGGGELPSSAWS